MTFRLRDMAMRRKSPMGAEKAVGNVFTDVGLPTRGPLLPRRYNASCPQTLTWGKSRGAPEPALSLSKGLALFETWASGRVSLGVLLDDGTEFP